MATFYRNIQEIRQANEDAGYYFFSPDTMRFFKSRVYYRVYGGKYFITSEIAPYSSRRYTIRMCKDNGGIETVSEQQEYGCLRTAKRYAAKL
jgi:hypothetical protein